jgi:hypothetical protein
MPHNIGASKLVFSSEPLHAKSSAPQALIAGQFSDNNNNEYLNEYLLKNMKIFAVI